MIEILLVITNCPDLACAQRLGAASLQNKLAACVNIGAAIQSTYHLQGKLESAQEIPLQLKTTIAAYPRLESLLKSLHPYTTPRNSGDPSVCWFARIFAMGPG